MKPISSGTCGRSSGVEHNLAKVRVVSSNLIARSRMRKGTALKGGLFCVLGGLIERPQVRRQGARARRRRNGPPFLRQKAGRKSHRPLRTEKGTARWAIFFAFESVLVRTRGSTAAFGRVGSQASGVGRAFAVPQIFLSILDCDVQVTHLRQIICSLEPRDSHWLRV